MRQLATIGSQGGATAWAHEFQGAARDIYRRTLLEMARVDPKIWCLDSDMGGLEETFAKALPDQYVDAGIAEANLVSMAAALAYSGKIPFVNTMASFAAARACEQLKVDVAYNNLPVRIVATHAGLSAGHMGPTHQAIEDIATLRAMPNLTIIVPVDAAETAKAVRSTMDIPGPVYIRLGRKPTPLVYSRDYAFAVGQAIELFSGGDVTIMGSGPYPILSAIEAHHLLAAEGIDARVLNMHTVKPLDVSAVVEAARGTAGIVTVEDHNIIGGLGSAVAEVLAEWKPAPMKRIGIPDRYTDRAGSHRELLEWFGVSANTIAEAARAIVEGRTT